MIATVKADPSWFRSWFEPEAHDRLPVAAVELVGVLVSESTTDRALQSCGTLLTLAPCAVMLPRSDASQAWSYIELDYYGIGVVVGDDSVAELMVPPEDRSPDLDARQVPSLLHRHPEHRRHRGPGTRHRPPALRPQRRAGARRPGRLLLSRRRLPL